MTDLKTLLKDNTVSFSRYRKGYLYYTIAEPSQHNPLDLAYLPTATYEFPVPIEDCGDATFPATDKAITFMRYIRKAREEGTFVKERV